MARHRKSSLSSARKPEDLLTYMPFTRARADRHASYAALQGRLTAFRAEISAQAKSRPETDAPAGTTVMAAELIDQIAALMGNCPEARGLPRVNSRAPASFSQIVIAIAQAWSAFNTYGTRTRFHMSVNETIQDVRELEDDEKKRRNTAGPAEPTETNPPPPQT